MLDEQIEKLRQRLELNSGDVWARVRLATLHIRAGDHRQGVEEYRTAVLSLPAVGSLYDLLDESVGRLLRLDLANQDIRNYHWDLTNDANFRCQIICYHAQCLRQALKGKASPDLLEQLEKLHQYASRPSPYKVEDRETAPVDADRVRATIHELEGVLTIIHGHAMTLDAGLPGIHVDAGRDERPITEGEAAVWLDALRELVHRGLKILNRASSQFTSYSRGHLKAPD